MNNEQYRPSRAELAGLLGAPVGFAAEAPREAVVVEQSDPARFMAALAVATAQGGVVLLASDAWGDRERRQLAALRTQPQITPATAAGKGWLCIATGGTGGQLKFARHDEETISAAVRGFALHFKMARVNAAGVLPLHHVSGLMAWMRCALTGGEYLPLDWKKIEGGALPDLRAKPDGWTISLVVTQLERLLRNDRAGSANPPSTPTVEWLRQFRIIFLGGGPASPALLDRAASLGLPVSLGYGMTETAAMVTALRPEEFLGGARTSGSALPHARVAIGADGAIVVGGDSLFRGYHPEWRDRWDFETSDRGGLDGQQQLVVAGRRDAVIITGGEKVDPAEVEQVLRDTGEFSDVVVLGVPDAEWGHAVVAAYPASARPDLAKVGQAMATALRAPQRPKQFIALPNWPANAQGKVNRAEILRQILGGQNLQN